ncbi:beta-N-acetylhexosaminidase [Nitratireductor pacificus]|uniref:beta-N-acetylhexosaminidase n=1 Tax=Nitratireductor pacificus pht-3B TaxID=391937 RepID=K2MCU7_9HYPH|nr:beta-N-acetylhexosaminidase [Nitratireductor pacificus]EKF20016.1 beta-N-acetylhexosaminidase [Nitratireductor pacificus pht-3B]
MTTHDACRLYSDWNEKDGVIELTLQNTGPVALSGAKLATTSLFRIHPECEIEGATLCGQLSNYHVFAQPKDAQLRPGERWVIRANRLSHVLRHYTYGVKSAFMVLEDGSTVPVAVEPMTRNGLTGAPRWETTGRHSLPEGAEPLSVIPAVLHADVEGFRDPLLPLVISADAPLPAQKAFSAVRALAARLFAGDEPLYCHGEGHAVAAESDPALPDGAYRIAFAPAGITLTAAGEDGFRHGLVTLGQMLRGARLRPGDFALPETGTIDDSPRFGWRGAHLDVARQFYAMQDIIDFLDCLAWNKLNRFHMHLNDDEAWRLEIPGWPALTEKAAFRGVGEILPPLLGAPAERTGGFYTGDDIRALVDHGAALGIEIIPEIDVPGHCHCVLEAHPELRDSGETGIYRSIQYFPNNALNPAVEATWDFLGNVFDTLVELFPSRYIHVGGDELADGAWMGSPKAIALGERLYGKAETFTLQSHFLKRVQAMLRERGRDTAAWEEAALGGGLEIDGVLLMAWKESKSGRALAEQGYQVVLTPAQHYYFDIARSTEWWEPGASWAGTVQLSDTYHYDPGSDWPEALRAQLAGVQSCLWSENLSMPGLFRHLVFPRLSAMAEGAWCASERKDFERFLAIQDLMPTSAKS